MSYTAVDTALLATRAAGDLRGRIGVALVFKAAVRADAIGDTDKLEAQVCREVLEDTFPQSWITMVLILLDLAGQLASQTDANINTQVDLAWGYFLDSRRLTG